MKIETASFGIEVDSDGLLDAGSPTGTLLWTPLQYACAIGDLDMAASLLQNDGNNRRLVHELGHTKGGYTALHIAVKFDMVQIVQLLIEHGADVDCVDVNGFTPLHLAAALGLKRVVIVLLHASAKHLPSKMATYPVECAQEAGHYDIAALLLPFTPSVSPQDTENPTPISSWLTSIGMPEYIDNFTTGGFDDLTFIQQNGLTMEDLVAIGITKRGHQLKLKRLYRIEEFIESDDEEDSDETESAEEDDSDDESEDSEEED